MKPRRAIHKHVERERAEGGIEAETFAEPKFAAEPRASGRDDSPGSYTEHVEREVCKHAGQSFEHVDREPHISGSEPDTSAEPQFAAEPRASGRNQVPRKFRFCALHFARQTFCSCLWQVLAKQINTLF